MNEDADKPTLQVSRGPSNPSQTNSYAMDLLTYTATLRASRDSVFNFIANIENLPRWAASFCERVDVEHGRWKGLTALGEVWLELDACRTTGAIVLHAGTSHDRLAPLPILVLKLGEGRTLVGVTFASVAARATELVRRDPRDVAADLHGLAKRFGGEVHQPAREARPVEVVSEPEVCGSVQFFF